MQRKERATTVEVTPEAIMRDFVGPLSTLAGLYAKEAADLEEAVKTGKVPRGYLPVVTKGALDSLAELRLFCENTLASKRRAAAAGKLRYREQELAKKREKYRETKIPQ